MISAARNAHLAALGIDHHIAERCLNHKLGARARYKRPGKGVESIYNRHEYFYERMTALEA